MRGRQQEEHMERRLVFDESDDSPQSATVTTHDFNKPTDGIIDLLDKYPPKRTRRRKRNVEK